MSAAKVLAFATLFLTTTLAQTEWKEFAFPDGNFSVLFPTRPQQQTFAERSLHQFSATVGAESYGLTYADSSPSTSWEAINVERDSIVNGFGGSVVDESLHQSKVIQGNGYGSSGGIRAVNSLSTSSGTDCTSCTLLYRETLSDRRVFLSF